MVSSWIFAALVVAGSPGWGDVGKFTGKPVKIAWLGGTPENTYDMANLDGARDVAKLFHGQVKPFYSYYDPAAQLQQCKDVVKSGKYDAILVIAASATEIIPCVTKASAAGIPIVATDLPIGPDATTTEPQVPGQTGAVLTPASEFADSLDGIVAGACADVAPCRIVYLAGTFDIVYDQLALAALDDIVAANPNVEVVSAQEGFYDTDTSYAIVEGLIADDVDFDLVIAAGDQMAMGAEWAIADAGIPEGTIAIAGGGAGEYGVQAVRDGRWYSTFVTLPYDEGALAAAIALAAARCLPVWDDSIDPVELRGLPHVLTADNLEEFEDFEAQWAG